MTKNLNKEEFYVKLEELYQEGLKNDMIFNDGIIDLINSLSNKYIAGQLSATYGSIPWDEGVTDVYEEFLETKDWSVWDNEKDGEVDMNWIPYNWENEDSHPPKPDRYLIYREGCDKMHFERWNGSGWASSNKDCTDWCKPKKPTKHG